MSVVWNIRTYRVRNIRGGNRGRTCDVLTANQVLYQLSYAPVRRLSGCHVPNRGLEPRCLAALSPEPSASAKFRQSGVAPEGPWRMRDSNPRRRASADLQSAPFGLSGNPPMPVPAPQTMRLRSGHRLFLRMTELQLLNMAFNNFRTRLKSRSLWNSQYSIASPEGVRVLRRDDRVRTCGLRIWSPLLYQLSYIPRSAVRILVGGDRPVSGQKGRPPLGWTYPKRP